jgi:hypothetical protein
MDMRSHSFCVDVFGELELGLHTVIRSKVDAVPPGPAVAPGPNGGAPAPTDAAPKMPDEPPKLPPGPGQPDPNTPQHVDGATQVAAAVEGNPNLGAIPEGAPSGPDGTPSKGKSNTLGTDPEGGDDEPVFDFHDGESPFSKLKDLGWSDQDIMNYIDRHNLTNTVVHVGTKDHVAAGAEVTGDIRVDSHGKPLKDQTVPGASTPDNKSRTEYLAGLVTQYNNSKPKDKPDATLQSVINLTPAEITNLLGDGKNNPGILQGDQRDTLRALLNDVRPGTGPNPITGKVDDRVAAVQASRPAGAPAPGTNPTKGDLDAAISGFVNAPGQANFNGGDTDEDYNSDRFQYDFNAFLGGKQPTKELLNEFVYKSFSSGGHFGGVSQAQQDEMRHNMFTAAMKAYHFDEPQAAPAPAVVPPVVPASVPGVPNGIPLGGSNTIPGTNTPLPQGVTIKDNKLQWDGSAELPDAAVTAGGWTPLGDGWYRDPNGTTLHRAPQAPGATPEPDSWQNLEEYLRANPGKLPTNLVTHAMASIPQDNRIIAGNGSVDGDGIPVFGAKGKAQWDKTPQEMIELLAVNRTARQQFSTMIASAEGTWSPQQVSALKNILLVAQARQAELHHA